VKWAQDTLYCISFLRGWICSGVHATAVRGVGMGRRYIHYVPVAGGNGRCLLMLLALAAMQIDNP
jgi:hypothetical protein